MVVKTRNIIPGNRSNENKKIVFDNDESKFIRLSLEEYLVSLKINNGSKSRIQRIQQIIDKMPIMEKNWVANAK